MIRPERLEDMASVRQVNIAAFARPGHPTDEADMVDALRANGKVILSLVAELGDQVVGHIVFSPLTFEPSQPRETGVALGPLAVRPEFQRQGIGSKLAKSGLEACRRLGYGSVFLFGNPSYYSRLGFRPARTYGITPPGPATDAFQALELREGALAGVSGTAYESEELS